MPTIYFDEQISDDQRRRELYAGALFVYSAGKSSRALCALAQEMCEAHFHPHNPTEAQHHLPVEKFIEILAELKPKFIHHPECKRLISEMLQELGCDPQRTYFDVPRLRTACAGDYLNSGLAYAFKPHRDTWYSPPMCQLNWWLPVYPIATQNAMAFHPNYWDAPVKNSSAEFDYQVWNETGRKAAGQQGKQDTRRQSEALEPLALETDLRVVCPPGGVIVFSASQMHSTVPNTSDETRISIDYRTVHLDEVETMTGAVNIDSQCSGTTMMDYLRCSDFEHLPQEIVDRYMQHTLEPRYPTPPEYLAAD